MPQTAKGLRYPVSGDNPLGPAQMQTLAEDVDARLTTISTIAPASPKDSALWYNPATQVLSLRVANAWVPITPPRIMLSPSDPEPPAGMVYEQRGSVALELTAGGGFLVPYHVPFGDRPVVLVSNGDTNAGNIASLGVWDPGSTAAVFQGSAWKGSAPMNPGQLVRINWSAVGPARTR